LFGQKVLISTYYKDTARYLYEGLTNEQNQPWLEAMGRPHIRRIDSGASPKDRIRLVERFAPVSNGYPEFRDSEEEIDILVSTDVLSEGQNLQDCGSETPRFPSPYDEINVFEVQEKVIADILSEVEQQQAAEIVAKPVAEEQAIIAQILRQQLHNPAYDRQEIRQLRNFLKQPLVGAAVQLLREAMKAYSVSNEFEPLMTSLRELYQQQSNAHIEEPR
jgi:hypothetical protein